jgi:peroxiredoxin Q/BCP
MAQLGPPFTGMLRPAGRLLSASSMTLPILAALLGATSLKVGDKAPDFTLTDTGGKQVTLSRMLEGGPVMLAFFPKAFTPG